MADVTRVYSPAGKTLYYISNVAEAPECPCGIPAVMLIAISNAGKLFGMYVCARNVQGDWRGKCDFRHIPNPG